MKFKDFLIEYDNWEGDAKDPDEEDYDYDNDPGKVLTGQVVFDFQLEVAAAVPEFDPLMLNMFESEKFAQILSQELGSMHGAVRKATAKATNNKLGGNTWTDFYNARVRQVKVDINK